MIKPERSNLQSFCRTCLDQLSTAEVSKYNLRETPNLTKLLIICTELDIQNDVDEQDAVYPQCLCTKCHRTLQDIQQFRTQAHDTAQKLKDIVNNVNIVVKEEFEPADDPLADAEESLPRISDSFSLCSEKSHDGLLATSTEIKIEATLSDDEPTNQSNAHYINAEETAQTSSDAKRKRKALESGYGRAKRSETDPVAVTSPGVQKLLRKFKFDELVTTKVTAIMDKFKVSFKEELLQLEQRMTAKMETRLNEQQLTINQKIANIPKNNNRATNHKRSIDHPNVTEDDSIRFTFKTISHIEEMNTLEDKLRIDEEYKNQFIDYMSTYCGCHNSMFGKGWDASYLLLDRLCTRQFLTKFSWTGSGAKQRKIEFRSYTEVITVFFDIIYAADNSFSVNELHKFFRQQLKNSKSRAELKNVRISKKRKKRMTIAYYHEHQKGADDDMNDNVYLKIDNELLIDD